MRKTKTNTGKIIPFFPEEREFSFLKKELHKDLDLVGESGRVILGPKVEELETKIAEISSRKYCVSCASGTDAITLSLKALGLKKGDEVILPTNSYPSVFGVALSGVTPIPVDIEDETASIDIEAIEKAITKKTKAILAVHLYGFPVNIKEIQAVCKKYNLFLVEDCAQATGSQFNNKSIGSFGDLAIFSFYPTKNLGAIGDGGAIVTDNKSLSDDLKALRMYGEKERYNSEKLGINSRLDELQAAFLLTKLKYLDSWINKRISLANIYENELKDIGDIKYLPQISNKKNSYHLFIIRTESRDLLQKWLSDQGIQTGIHYPKSIHQIKMFKQKNNKKYPISEKWNKTVLSLPMHPFLTEEEIKFVVKKVKDFFKKN